MSKATKLRKRLLSIPKDFTWDELVIVVKGYGFEERTDSGGSRRCFVSSKGQKIFLHEPHPHNTVKAYALREVVSSLKEFGINFEETND